MTQSLDDWLDEVLLNHLSFSSILPADNLPIVDFKLKDELTAHIEKEILRSRIEESKLNYNITIKAIREVRDNPNAYWHKITEPMADRIADLNSQIGVEDG